MRGNHEGTKKNEDHENRDVDVGHLQPQRLLQQPEQRRLGAERDDGEGGEGGGGGDDRRERKEQRIGRARPQLLLEHQLDDVGERLQHALRADEVRTEPLLQERGDLPLDVHHDRRRVEQHEEHEEREDDLRDEERRHPRRVLSRAPESRRHEETRRHEDQFVQRTTS